MQEASGRRHQGEGIKAEASWRKIREEASGRRHQGGREEGIRKKATGRRHHGEGIMGEASWTRHHGGGIMEEGGIGIREASGRHLGCSWRVLGEL